MSVVAIDARLAGGSNTGDSTYWTCLLYGLSRIAPDLRFLLFSNAEKPQEIPWCDQFQWIHLPSRSSRWWSYALFPLRARRLGARVTHTQYSLSPLSVRGITTVHDVSFFIGPEWFQGRDRFLLQRTVPAACRRAARVITVSETSRREIEHYIAITKGKVSVTYNACPPWIKPMEPEAARKKLAAFGVDGPYLLTVGTRWPRKNMALAVKAVEELPSDFPHRLVITGKAGWGEQGIGSRGREVGYVSNADLSALYSGADLYLAPSRHEGFGVPLLEAFRCGCPVVCSSGGALPEVAGDAAEVIKSWDSAEWSSSLATLLRDSSKLHDLRRRGREREAQFSWEDTARKTIQIYQEVMR